MLRAESSSWGAQATRPIAGAVRRTDALGNGEGESGLPLAAQAGLPPDRAVGGAPSAGADQ